MFTTGLSEPGGAAKRCRLLVHALAQRGWEVRVVARAGTLRRFVVSNGPNLRIVDVPGFGSRWGMPLFITVGTVMGVLWGRSAAVVAGVQLSSPLGVAAVAGWLTGRPYVLFSTSSGEFSEAEYLRTARLSGLRLRMLRRASWVIAQTPTAARELRTLVAEERVTILPNPVERVHAPDLTGEPRALYTGRFSSEKDLPRVLEAWRQVAADREGATLTLAGSGGSYRSVESQLRRMVAADPVLGRSVRFTGWVADLAPFFADSDVYVFASRSEGMSNALLEACAWKRVVVASDIPPNRAVLGDDYPLLFPVGDTKQLGALIARAFDDPSVREKARAHIARRLDQFSVDTVVTRLEELFDVATRRAGH